MTGIDVKQSFSAVRAIGSEFARRTYWPVAIIVGVSDAILLVVMVWLVSLSAWWLLLAIPVFILVVISVGLLVVARLVIGIVTPQQTSHQKQDVARFVDKLQTLSDIAQTPKPILLFRIVRDVIAPRRNGFIQSASSDTLSLKKDFIDLQRTFNQQVIEQ